jgi:hypothetical protein
LPRVRKATGGHGEATGNHGVPGAILTTRGTAAHSSRAASGARNHDPSTRLFPQPAFARAQIVAARARARARRAPRAQITRVVKPGGKIGLWQLHPRRRFYGPTHKAFGALAPERQAQARCGHHRALCPFQPRRYGFRGPRRIFGGRDRALTPASKTWPPSFSTRGAVLKRLRNRPASEEIRGPCKATGQPRRNANLLGFHSPRDAALD